MNGTLMSVEGLTALDLSNSAHLQSKHFPEGVSAVLTIRGFRKELCKGEGDEEAMRTCLVFREIDKTLVLNETKLGALTKLFGRSAAEWIGQRLRLVGGETMMKGKPVGCINIKSSEPVATNGVATNGAARHEATQPTRIVHEAPVMLTLPERDNWTPEMAAEFAAFRRSQQTAPAQTATVHREPIKPPSIDDIPY